MSSFACTCGNIIRDQTDNIPYKASFIADRHSQWLSNMSEIIAAYIQAQVQGQRDKFIRRHLGDESLSLPDNSIIFDILTMPLFDIEGLIYECEQCGRLWVERPTHTQLLPYSPESSTRGIFESD